MRKIGFVGVFDKTDLILSIAKILSMTHRKVLFIDATVTQKAKYVVPNIIPTSSYLTEYQGIDIAVGFESMNRFRQYAGLDDDENPNYDYIFVDVDDSYGYNNFDISKFDYIYYTTSFDAYSLKKGLEILRNINIPARMAKIFYSKEMYKEERDYFNYLSLDLKVEWNETELYFLLENGDQSSLIENQRLQEIKFRNLSNTYKENVIYLVNEIEPSLGEKEIKNIMKGL